MTQVLMIIENNNYKNKNDDADINRLLYLFVVTFFINYVVFYFDFDGKNVCCNFTSSWRKVVFSFPGTFIIVNKSLKL